MRYAIVSRCLGLLLLLAAALKVYGFGAEPVARMGIFAALAFQFLIVIFEMGLGVWLLSGKQQPAAWAVVLSAFVSFAAITFYQGWIGQASCGCLGSKVSVNPWIMFSVDLAAVGSLLIARPDLKPLWDNRVRLARATASVVGVYLLLMGILAAVAYYGDGSVDAALASLRNERLSISPSMIDMGVGAPGETREAKVELTNRTEHPIRLIGGTSDCSCTVIGDLPVTIPPGEARSITVAMHLPNAAGSFNRKAEFKIDDEGFRRISFRLTGRIRKALH